MGIQWQPLQSGNGGYAEFMRLGAYKPVAPMTLNHNQQTALGRPLAQDDAPIGDDTSNLNWGQDTQSHLSALNTSLDKLQQYQKDRDARLLELENQLKQGANTATATTPTGQPTPQPSPTPTSAPAAPTAALAPTKINTKKLNSYQKSFLDELLKGGLSDNQARAIMMSVMAENGWRNDLVFGTHQDVTKRAHGALSWQGGRETGLYNLYNQMGLMRNGKVVASDAAMRAQAKHLLNELKTSERRGWKGMQALGANADPYELARYYARRIGRGSNKADILAGREHNYRRMMNLMGG